MEKNSTNSNKQLPLEEVIGKNAFTELIDSLELKRFKDTRNGKLYQASPKNVNIFLNDPRNYNNDYSFGFKNIENGEETGFKLSELPYLQLLK